MRKYIVSVMWCGVCMCVDEATGDRNLHACCVEYSAMFLVHNEHKNRVGGLRVAKQAIQQIQGQ